MKRISNLLKGYFSLIRNTNMRREKDTWIFGEWFGKKCCDNCLYLVNELCETHPELNLLWVTEDGTDTNALSPRVTVIRKDTETCRNLLRRAGVVIMNQEYLDFSETGRNYFNGAVTVNLWHGLMWKKIGYDLRNRHDLVSRIYQKTERKTETADYWLVTSSETQERFEHAYHLGKNRVIKAGYPRNSIFYNQGKMAIAKQKVMKLIGSLIEYESDGDIPIIITYMPTFRDKREDCFSFLKEDCPKLDDLLEKYNAVIVEKSHFITSRRGNDKTLRNRLGRIVRLNDVQATELLAATDILITDYSSCFFDYLLLNRPIIHYIYDYDYYVNSDRGVYYTKEQIACGRTPETMDELLNSIEIYLNNPSTDENLRQRQRQRFWAYDSQDACERIYRQIRELQKKRYKV